MALTQRNDEPDSFYVDTLQAMCEGSDAGLTHPRVFLEVEHNGSIICPYCSRKFTHKP